MLDRTRRLRLRKDTLTEISRDDMSAVAGGTHFLCGATDDCTHGPSLDVTCPTTPLYVCATQFTLYRTCLCPE